jgi:ketosteroid isomerase-like protein
MPMTDVLRSFRMPFAALPGLVLVLGCGGSSSVDADAVRKLVTREAEAMQGHDLKTLEGLWSESPDILLYDVAPPGRFQGWPAIARTYNDFLSRTSDLKIGVDHLRVDVDGTLAVATYDWTLSGKLDEAQLQDRGATTAVYRKEKTGWRLVHAHVSAAPRGEPAHAESGPAPPAASAPAASTPAAPKAPAAK